MVLSEFVARNNAALATLINKHKVVTKKFPDSLLNHLGGLAGQVMNDLASKDPLSREVFDDILKFRKSAISWSARSEGAFLSARNLPFKYAQPKG